MFTYISRRLKAPFSDVVTRITESLHHNGFSIISTLNLSDELRSSLNIPFRNYLCLSVVCPELCYGVISLESHAGLLSQSSIVIQEHENGEVEISASNPLELVEKAMNANELRSISDRISAKLRSALDELHAPTPQIA